MTKRTRTILFLLLGTSFFVLAPTIILYSQGYRFDWDTKWFSQVGAFYFNITPTRAQVFVNEKPIGKTAYVLGTALSKNFSPDPYFVRVEKEGYHSWEKLLEVFPRQVTEAKHIVLFPMNPAFVTLQDNSVRWDQDSNSFIFSTASQEAQEYAPNPALRSAVAFLEKGPEALWLDQEGILWRQTNQNAKALQLNQTPFLVRTETTYTIHPIGNEFFLQENQTLYILNKQTKAFDEFFAPFTEMVLSPDTKKLALSSGNEIWLYFLEEEREQPSRSKGDKVFLTRFSEDIANLGWFDSHHLLFTRLDTIVLSEIDNRDHLNMVELAEFSQPSIFWQGATKTLFVHTGNQILSSEKLLP